MFGRCCGDSEKCRHYCWCTLLELMVMMIMLLLSLLQANLWLRRDDYTTMEDTRKSLVYIIITKWQHLKSSNRLVLKKESRTTILSNRWLAEHTWIFQFQWNWCAGKAPVLILQDGPRTCFLPLVPWPWIKLQEIGVNLICRIIMKTRRQEVNWVWKINIRVIVYTTFQKRPKRKTGTVLRTKHLTSLLNLSEKNWAKSFATGFTNFH